MKTKPKGDSRDLVTGTFPHRRQWILSNCLPLKDIISQYPHLPKPSYWKQWEDAVINYTKTNKSQPKELRDALDTRDVIDKDINNLIALHRLHYFLVKKQLREDVSNYCILALILMQAPRGTPPQEVIDNHPHILRFVDADNEILPHYFISIEQQLHM